MNERRRLSDKIMEAHSQACADAKMSVAEILLKALETELSAIGGSKADLRQATEMLEAAFARHEEARKLSIR
jgi:hypothetical protein